MMTTTTTTTAEVEAEAEEAPHDPIEAGPLISNDPSSDAYALSIGRLEASALLQSRIDTSVDDGVWRGTTSSAAHPCPFP